MSAVVKTSKMLGVEEQNWIWVRQWSDDHVPCPEGQDCNSKSSEKSCDHGTVQCVGGEGVSTVNIRRSWTLMPS